MAVDLESIRDRVRAQLPGLFNSVSDVTGAAEAMSTPCLPPAAFVAVASERAAANRTQGAHRQRVDVDVSVLMCFPAQRADHERADVVELGRLAVIGALAGWTPTGAGGSLDYKGYRIVRMGDGLIWPEATFGTYWHLDGA